MGRRSRSKRTKLIFSIITRPCSIVGSRFGLDLCLRRERMRLHALMVALVLGLAAAGARSQDPSTTRYKVELDLDNYPQKTAKEALESVVKAIDAKQIDYLVAQL